MTGRLNQFGQWMMERLSPKYRSTASLAKIAGISRREAERLLYDPEPQRQPGGKRSDGILNLMDEVGVRTPDQRRYFLLRMIRDLSPQSVQAFIDELEMLTDEDRRRAEISDRALRAIFDAVNSGDASSATVAINSMVDRLSASRVRAIAAAVDRYNKDMQQLNRSKDESDITLV